jgi:hypothetical protein
LDQIDALEVWNYCNHPSQPEAVEFALSLWNELWNDGYRVPGVAGSDVHGTTPYPRSKNDPPFPEWDIMIFIHADGLSVQQLLHGIRQRQVYVTRGPYLEAEIEVGHEIEIFGIGDDLTAAVERSANNRIEVRYALKLHNTVPGAIHWIENGKEIAVQPIAGDGTYRSAFMWNRDSYTWLRPEIRSTDGALQAFANPVFSGSQQPEMTTWQQLTDRAGIGDSFKKPYAIFTS